MAITRRKNRLESCSNPLKIFEDQQFRLEEKIFSLRSRFFVNVCRFRGCLCIFLYIWIMTSLPGSRTIHQIWRLEIFLDSRLQYESLEGLMDFLAFLVQKLWPNFRVLIREIPTNSLGNPYKIRGLSAITWGPETSGSRSRPLQLHIPAQNTTKL